jgi:hypothetical protein
MPDNWGFVIAAYALVAVVLGAYWRWLSRREHDLLTSRSRQPSTTGHPRSDPGKRAPLQ